MFNRGGLRFILALRIVLPVIAETLLHRADKYSGAWLLIALYTMPTVSCCIISCVHAYLRDARMVFQARKFDGEKYLPRAEDKISSLVVEASARSPLP